MLEPHDTRHPLLTNTFKKRENEINIFPTKKLSTTAPLASCFPTANAHMGPLKPKMTVEQMRTAFVVTKSQNDFLNSKGATWG